jgi:hypothetical protein
MSKLRQTAVVFQLGFVALLLACRVIASIGDTALAEQGQPGHGIETSRFLGRS